ncbi:phage terminase small subunit [Streptomyces anulatus]|uniref:phage terminase small subunit n=1 Tax=Streptomyces anulatus TaxID=1892 RepID=UPI003681D803
MAGVGPTPSPNRRRKNTDPVATTILPADGYTGPSPDFPGGHDYDARTLSWYETWRASPQAATFLATDWQRLHMLAELVEKYWAEPSKELLSEIRLNEASIGGTPADRMRLRWSLGTPEVGKGSERAAERAAARQGKDDPRKRLRAVGDE